MLPLTQTEFYTTNSHFMTNVSNEANAKFAKNIGVIMPQNIEIDISNLEKYAKGKSAASPCLLPAIDLFKNYGGKIQLFDFSTPSSPVTDVNANFPFLPSFARRTDLEKFIPAVYVNVYNMGRWSDNNDYTIQNPLMDLHSCLETGFIAYKMIIDKRADEILSNPVVLEYLTRIYTQLFYLTIRGIPGSLQFSGFQLDAAKFIIAKFFLKHIVQKDDGATNDIARKASDSASSLQSLILYEDNLGIEYDRLSTFLYSFGQVFYNGHPVSFGVFARQWTTMYGEGTTYAIEYIPYLIHYLFATYRGSLLGNSSRLLRYKTDLQKLGLPKLYNAVMQGVLR